MNVCSSHQITTMGTLVQDHPVLVGIAGLGELIWLLAYLLIIRKAYQNKTFGMPAIAVFASLALEAIFGLVCPWTHPELCPHNSGLALWSWWVFIAMSIVLLLQYLGHGETSEQVIPALRRHRNSYVVVGLLFFLFAEYFFIEFYKDYNANTLNFLVNLTMSILFVPLLLSRPTLAGMSWWGGWAKMIGAASISLSVVLTIQYPEYRQEFYPGAHESFAYVYFLFVATLFFDVLYIFLFYRRRGELAQPGKG